MRFATRFDRWLLVLVVLTGVVAGAMMPLRRFLVPGSSPGPQWLALMPLMVWIGVLACTLPQYYEVREKGLFLRQGWRRNLISWASLAELQSMSDSRSAAVFSTDRILVVTLDGRRFVIAVREQERFMAEVSKRCPHLEKRSFGLSVPLAPLSTA